MFNCYAHSWSSRTEICPVCHPMETRTSSATDLKIDAKPWLPLKGEPDLEKIVEKAFKNHENTFLKLRILELEDQLKQLFEKIDEFSGQPTKDAAKKLKDIANKLRGLK